jgi:hypothetical protein
MGARENSLKNATYVFKYGFGLGACGFGLALFNRQHAYATGFICFIFLALGAFFLSATRIELESEKVKYRRWIRWHSLAYSQIMDCGESWVYGYIRPRRFAFPWGKIYFLRPNASDSLFGLDKEMISTIRSKANI